MVRPSFIKGLLNQELTLFEKIYESICYNEPVCTFIKFGRFLKRLPKWIKLCWKTENWDFEGIYDFIEMQLKEMRKAQEQDTWHAEHGKHRAIQQIDCTLGHLDRFRNWPKYWEWPDAIHEQLPDGNWTIKYRPEDEPKCDLVHKMEEKHFNKFWYMMKKYLHNWWT